MEKIAVCIHSAQLLERLRYAFSNRYTVVTELMQNARRAGAAQVIIDYNSATQTLVVGDDGVGILDWPKLFAVGESGWDATLARDEHAFGVGFMNSLYSARRCTVRSRDRMIAFDTREALRQLPIDVQAVAFAAQTVVTLEGVVLPELAVRMEVLASAFPIAVIYNGALLARPLALDSRPYVATAIGQVHLAGTQDGQAASSSLFVLQGFAVYGDPRFDRAGNVVHLDPRQFHARLPDRDVLVDEGDVVQAVEGVLRAMWRARLEEARRTLSSEAFVAKYFDAAVMWGASDLFAEVPFLPGRLFARIAGYPIQEGYSPADYLQALPGLVHQAQFASGDLQAVMLPAARRGSFAYWMFAQAKGLLVLTRTWGLAEGHWLWEYVHALDDQPAEVEIVGERVRAKLDGRWVAPDVVLCEAYRVSIGADAAELTEQAMAWSGVRDEEDLIVVPDAEHCGTAVLQCSSYLDEDDRWRGEFAEEDRAALASLIGRLRSRDPTDAMRSLIGELRLENYPCLQGRTFSLEIRAERGAHEVRLVS